MEVLRGRDWQILAGVEQPISELITSYPPKRDFLWDKELFDVMSRLETVKYAGVDDVEKITGRAPFAGMQFSLNKYKVKDGVLSISLSPATYYDAIRDHKVATMKELQEKMTSIGARLYGDNTALYAKVLATNVAIKTKDNLHVIQLRDPKQAEYQLAFGNTGGHPKPENFDTEGKVNWHDVMRTQIQKELGVSPNDVAHLELIGLGENTNTHKPDLLYRADISLTSDELIEKKGEEDWELLGKYFVSEEELPKFIAKNQNKGTLYFPEGTSPTTNYLVKKTIDEHGLDPTTSTNFCPVHEAALVLVLQMDGYDLTDVYQNHP